MDFIYKILLEGLWTTEDTIFDVDYYSKISFKEMKKKSYIVASRFGVNEVKQAKSGSCYFIIFNPHNHFIYEVRISNHPPSPKNKDKNVKTINLTFSQSIPEMVRFIKNTIRE